MAITNKDIVLYQSQDNTDNDSGGGSRTSNPVVDGAVNNLFPDISRIDTTSGDVALRKVFPVVNTDNRDIYYGAHAMLRQVPSDPNVSALIFYTDDPHDIRSEAQNKIEAYVVPSFRSSFYLYGNHIEGSKAVTWLQLLEESIPDVGETYLLKFGSVEQYIRVDKIETQTITLTFQQSTYQRRRIIATITQPLTYAFPGSSFTPSGQEINTTDTFNTQIADAAKFYGTKELKLDATVGQSVITVDSIYEQLIPSTTKQTPLINNDGLNQGEYLINDPDSDVAEIEVKNAGSSGVPFATPTPILPGSLRNNFGYTDDGNGNINDSSGVKVGSVDYKTGSVTITGNVGIIYYQPGSVRSASIKNSAVINVTQENQGSVYVLNLNPMPNIPNLYVDYRTGGKWYRIACNQDGTLGNDAAIGAGNLNDNGDGTGTVSVTLGANPDLDSQIIASWSDQGSLVKETTVAPFTLRIPLNADNIKPGTFSMTYGSSGNKVITDDATGNLTLTDSQDPSNDITGSLNYTNNELIITDVTRTSSTPVVGENCNIQYEEYGEVTSGDGATSRVDNPTFTQSVNGDGLITYTGNVGAINGKKMIIGVTGRYTDEIYGAFDQSETITIQNVRDQSIPSTLGLRAYKTGVWYHIIKGEYDTSGNVTFSIAKRKIKKYTTNYLSGTGIIGAVGNAIQTSQGVVVYEESDEDSFIIESIDYIIFQSEEIPPTTPVTVINESLTVSDVAEATVDFPANVVGDVAFEIGQYSFRSSGSSILSQSGAQVGSFNAATGDVRLDYTAFINNISSFDVNVTRCYTDTTVNQSMTRLASFRTASDDLVTSSLQVRYKTINGTYNATSDGNGVITGTDIDETLSFVDTRTGAVILVFTAAVDPTSIKYDAVAQTTLPLDPELLGLNPVRLPPNGRVPVFRPGYHLVIFNEQETAVTGTPLPGDEITLARDKQSYVEIVDVNGARLDFTQYSADRETGVVTFADPLDLVDRNGDPMTAPFTIIDRVEDMVLCTSADINGVVSISAPLTRDYLLGETKVASALVWGDIGARYYNLFSQQSFDVWSDEMTTNPTTAQYDDVNYPIQINNQDSVAGRWMVRFKSSTTVEVVEEQLGVVLESVNITNTNIAPLNPATNQPYFTMDFNGFGSGWVTGNIIRFNTDSGDENMWLIRTVKSGQLTVEVDAMDVEIRGDAN